MLRGFLICLFVFTFITKESPGLDDGGCRYGLLLRFFSS